MILNGWNALLRRKIVLRSPSKKMNEDRPILSAAKCRSMNIVSRNIRYMRIFAGVPRGRASKDSGVVDDDIFWLIRWLFLRKIYWQHYYMAISIPWPAVIVCKKTDLKWLWMAISFFMPAVLLRELFVFKAHHKKTNEDRRTQSAIKLMANECSF